MNAWMHGGNYEDTKQSISIKSAGTRTVLKPEKGTTFKSNQLAGIIISGYFS